MQGIIPSGNGPSDINSCGMSADQSLVVTGDDNGLVNVYRNPCLEGHKANKYRAHSEHVTTTMFSDDGQYIYSVGGQDQCCIQWKLKGEPASDDDSD